MGKRKFNAKGRQVVETIQDDSETKQIKLDKNSTDVSTPEYGGYDVSNALVLPSTKRKSKLKKNASDDGVSHVTRILSKKQRKNLEKIVDKKKKKEGRSTLLEKLATVQLPADELKKYTSITNVQTKGLKKHLLENHRKDVVHTVDVDNDKQQKWSSIAGASKKIKRLALLHGYANNDDDDSSDNDDEDQQQDPNFVGINNPSSGSEIDESEDEILANEKDNDKNGFLEKLPKNEQNEISKNKEEKPKPVIQEENIKKVENRITIHVPVDRTKKIQAARLKLPILSEEREVMETINENSIVILTGETGSGKTTQIPQFLYEAGYAENGKMIGITEPRRVAAISMSKRVAIEMNLPSSQVSYLIRFEGNATSDTRIKFMTDGVLLKEIESDFVLSKYSVIILDEAHERSIYTDILVGLLSRIVLLRNKRNQPLKLIIMSATLRVEDFTSNQRLFKIPPPVINVEARQFPVTIHFNKRTSDEYVKEAVNKAIKIHNKLPEGGILIFLTGQQEVNYVVRKLRKSFPYKKETSKKQNGNKNEEETNGTNSESDDDDEFDIKKAIKNSKKAKKKLLAAQSLPQINLDDYKLPTDDTEADLLDMECIKDSEDENDENDDAIDDLDDSENDDENIMNLVASKNNQPLWVLPLYSLLASEKQSRVFEPPPPGTRLCVVTTNVAETSLTIPNIKYVIDCGRQKTRLYDKVTGVSSFVVTYTNKASADQRAGRAGRTAPGHCYRLYSSAVFNDEFEKFAIPDIQRQPVEHLMLQMKCMGIDKVINFPFPSPPDRIQLEVAELKLKLLGALEIVKSSSPNDGSKKLETNKLTKVTQLGQAISAFPVSPRFGKMLALSHQHNLLAYTVCMVSALSVQEVLLEVSPNEDLEDGADEKRVAKKSKWFLKRQQWAGHSNSLKLGDPVVLLRAVGASEYAGSLNRLPEFCANNGLRPKAIAEIRKLRVQLTNEINLSMPEVNLMVDPKMEPPSDLQAKLLRQILLSGMGDQVAKRIPDDELKDKTDRQKLKYAYRCPEMEDPVFLHSSSVLRKSRPEWVIYQEIFELENGSDRKMFMRGVTEIEPEWLLTYVKDLCLIRSIKEDPMPRYNSNDGKLYCYVDATFGRSGWEIPMAEIEMPLSELACRYFAMYFVNGDVFPSIAEYRKSMRSSPKNVIKTWSKNVPHILNLVNRLIREQITSKQKLINQWKINKQYLLQEFCEFLTDVGTNELSRKWPPIDNEH